MEKSKLMMIIIIVLLVVLLATVGGVAFYVLSLINNQNQQVDEGSGGYDIVKEVKLEDLTNVAIGTEIVTNLKTSIVPGSNGAENEVKHNVRVSAFFSYDKTAEESADFATLLAEPGVIEIARSIAVDCLNSVTAEEIGDSDGKAMLADTLKASLQDEFDTNLIVNVYFSDWVIT